MHAFKCVSCALLVGSAVVSSAFAERSENWLENYEQLLGKDVISTGVKYSEWKDNMADVQALQGMVEAIARTSVSAMGNKDQLAFYISAYNAWILREALGKYPTKSVKDPLSTFFLGKRIKVAGEEMSFNHLEKDIIRSKFGEPRVHFALNCASRSCPPLNRQAFRGGELDTQLEKRARAFVNSDNGVKYSADKKSAELSINRRRAPPLPNDVKINYQDYNWSLNEAK